MTESNTYSFDVSNSPFTGLYFWYMIGLFAITLYLCFMPGPRIVRFLELAPLPLSFRLLILALGLLHVASCLIFERYFILGLFRKMSRVVSWAKFKFQLKKVVCQKMTIVDRAQAYSDKRHEQIRYLLSHGV